MSIAAEKPSPPENVEVDLWWGGQAGWSMLPSCLVCIGATIALIGTAIHLARAGGLPADEARYAVYALGGLLWMIQFTRAGLRLVAVNYRLTTHRIYCWKSLFTPPMPPIELTAVSHVAVEQSPLERLLGVGRVRILTRQGQGLILRGVAAPRQVAALIEDRLEKKQRVER